MYNQIEKFKKGLLTGEQLQAFQRAMKEDEVLQSLVDNYDAIGSVSDMVLEKQLLSEVEAVHENMAKTHKGVNSKWLMWGLAILIFLIVSFISYQSLQKQALEEAFFATYEKPLFIKNTRTVEVETLASRGKAGYLFATNRYEEAEDVLVSLIDQSTDQVEKDSIYFMLGHVYIQQKKWESAVEAFRESRLQQARSLEERILKRW